MTNKYMKTQSSYHNVFRFRAGKRILLGVAALLLLASGAQAQFVSTVVSNGLFEPNSVATDAGKNAYITDASDDQILKFVPGTGALTLLAGGSPGTNSGVGPLAEFNNPLGIVAARGGLVVVDQGNHAIRFVSTNGVVSAAPIAGVLGKAGTNDGPGTSALFNFPSGIAADAQGNLYVVDQGNNLIREIDTNNVVTTIVTSNGYVFNQPTSVAVDNQSNIWVSDTGNSAICMISNQTVNVIAPDAGFSVPTALLWVGGASNTLFVADTGNQVIRSISFVTNQFGSAYYSVETMAGIPGKAGNVDGAPSTAEFNAPVGLGVDPFDSGYYVVDRDGGTARYGISGGAVRVFQVTAPLPPPAAPVLGFVTFVPPSPEATPLSVFTASADEVFNNAAIIAVKAAANSQTFVNYGATGTSIAAPGPGSGSSPEVYQGDNLLPNQTAPTIIVNQMPDVTIYAVSEGPGGQLSSNVTARFQWVTANPILSGNNAADIGVSDITAGAAMYYTIDGVTVPTNAATTNCFGPVYSGTNISLVITSNTTLMVRGFATNFAPSGTVSLYLTISNYIANTVGFSPRTTAAGTGATLAVPVFVTMAQSNAPVESIQFRAEIAPTGGNVNEVAPLNDLSFFPTDFVPLAGSQATIATFEWETYSVGLAQGVLINTYTNSGLTLSGYGAVSLLEIPIPKTVTKGQTYSLTIINPSGTSDGNQAGIALVGLTNTLTITDPVYFAGDSSPANGYNAGEFGDGSLDNSDVNNAMYASVGIRVPPVFTDAYNDMDVYPPDNGDGLITFLDWETILQRSVGLDTNNWIRFRADGGALMHQQVSWKPGGTPIPLSAPEPMMPAISKTSGGGTPPGQVWLRQALVGAVPQTGVQPGSTCSIPVYAKIGAGYSVSGLQFRAIVTAEGAAPAPGAITFTPAAGVQNPTKLPGNSANDIACFWGLGAFASALQGSNYLGVITFQVPATAQTGQSYALHFQGVDGAPDISTSYQFESLPGQVWVNSAALQPAQISSDEWRAHFFGSYTSPLAADNVDADGDGMLNWQEYVAGTNPTNAQSKLQFTSAALNNVGVKDVGFTWLTAPGKTYILQSTPSLNKPVWTAVKTIVGDGNNYQFIESNYSAGPRFYRLDLQP